MSIWLYYKSTTTRLYHLLLKHIKVNMTPCLIKYHTIYMLDRSLSQPGRVERRKIFLPLPGIEPHFLSCSGCSLDVILSYSGR
jgi:hypothetical protein